MRKAALAQPSGIAAGRDLLFVADAETSAIRRYDPLNDVVTTLVGKGLFTFGDADGPGEQALLQRPLGVAWEDDSLYIADANNDRILHCRLDTGARREMVLKLGSHPLAEAA